jgi:hypothetical protein
MPSAPKFWALTCHNGFLSYPNGHDEMKMKMKMKMGKLYNSMLKDNIE